MARITGTAFAAKLLPASASFSCALKNGCLPAFHLSHTSRLPRIPSGASTEDKYRIMESPSLSPGLE
ncbi:hypothetical protein Amuc03_01918 [Akkermansia muciniphila]